METELDFSDTNIDGFDDVCHTIASNKNLERVYLSGCKLTDDHVTKLCHVLPESSIRELYLTRNVITDCGGKQLIQCLSDTRLVVLKLGKCVSSEITSDINQILQSNSKKPVVRTEPAPAVKLSTPDLFTSPQQALQLLREQQLLARKLGVNLPEC